MRVYSLYNWCFLVKTGGQSLKFYYNYERPHQSLDYKTVYEIYSENFKNNIFDKVN